MTLTIHREKLYSMLEYLLAAMLIIDCRTIWQRLYSTPSWFNIATWFFLAAAVVGCIVTRMRFNKRTFDIVTVYLCVGVMYIAGFILLRPSSVSNFLKLGIAVLLMAIYLAIQRERDGVQSLLRKYADILSVVAIVTVFFWLFGALLGIIPNTGYVYTNWETVFSPKVPTWFHMFYTTQRSEMFGLDIMRNTALFTEAPMAAFHFSLALIINMFLKGGKKWQQIALTTALLTTLSVTAYMLLLFAYLAKFLITRSKNHIIRFIKIVIVPAVGVIAGIVAIYLISTKLESGSGSSRMDDFRMGFELWAQNPIFGYGYKSADVAHVGYSNSVIPILTQGGIFFAVFYLINFGIGIYQAAIRKNINQLIFIGLFLFLFVITNVAFQHLTLFFVLCISNLNSGRRKINLTVLLTKKQLKKLPKSVRRVIQE